MKSHYTTKDIAAALKITERAVRINATQYRWDFQKGEKIRGGGFEYLFPFASLPLPIRRALMAYELKISKEMIPEKEIDETALKAVLTRFNAAPEYNKKRAMSRHGILEGLKAYQAALNLGITQAEEAYTRLYQNQNAPGIEAWIYGVEPGFSVGTLRRWKKAFREWGLAGLLTEYGGKKGKNTAITPEMRIYITGQIAGKPHLRPARIFEAIEAKYNCASPDRSTVYRFVEKWKAENAELFALMEDPRRHKNQFQAAAGSLSADVPHAGHTWEMDSTPADVMTLDGKRCALIGAIDVYTRRAKVVVTPTSQSLGIAACMRRALIDWGMPSRIRMDNGKDYVSKHVRAITTALQIETPPLPKYTPEAKGFIERFFGTMTRQLEENLPGYLGHSVAERGAIRERKTWGSKIMKRPEDGANPRPVDVPLTMAELQTAVDQWLEHYENVKTHVGLKKTPARAAQECLRHPSKIRDERALDVLLAPVGKGTYTIHKDGVHAGGVYWANEMIGRIGTKVTIRQDLEDAGRVYVFDLEKGKYLCTAKDEALSGQRLSDYMAAKNHHKKDLKRKVRALEIISETTSEAYTVQLETGEMVNAQTGELKEGTTGQTVVAFRPECNVPAVREAKKAFRAKPKLKGLADEMGAVIPIKKAAQEPPKTEAEIEVVMPINSGKETGKWEEYPVELLDSPPRLYQWYLDREAAVGLREKDRDHMRFLFKNYESIRIVEELKQGGQAQ